MREMRKHVINRGSMIQTGNTTVKDLLKDLIEGGVAITANTLQFRPHGLNIELKRLTKCVMYPNYLTGKNVEVKGGFLGLIGSRDSEMHRRLKSLSISIIPYEMEDTVKLRRAISAYLNVYDMVADNYLLPLTLVNSESPIKVSGPYAYLPSLLKCIEDRTAVVYCDCSDDKMLLTIYLGVDSNDN